MKIRYNKYEIGLILIVSLPLMLQMPYARGLSLIYGVLLWFASLVIFFSVVVLINYQEGDLKREEEAIKLRFR